MMNLKGKKILIGITGGIASYKVCELIRMFVKAGADVKTVLTPSALNFVTKTTLSTLTKNDVYIDQFDAEDWKPEHINLADSSDLFLIVPATANTISKIANGICDNLLTSLACAYSKKIIIAPAMNCNMWENKFIRENIKKLSASGMEIIQPEKGFLACGYEGNGRMAKTDLIYSSVIKAMNQKKLLEGKRIVITAGGTKEAVDPVRYIGNHSSGKMGIAIADKAHESGAEVVLISTVNVEKPYKVINVASALEMLEETQKTFKVSDVLIMAAAVADYRPFNSAEHKIKKENNDILTIELIKNPDILKEIAFIKKDNQTVIGFCAETQDLLKNAKSKLKNKSLDFIIANDVSNKEIGFNSDYNEITILSNDGSVEKIDKMSKISLAEIILSKTILEKKQKVKI